MRVVIVGAGEVGSYLARVLSAQDMEIVLVDKLASALGSAEEVTDVLALRGERRLLLQPQEVIAVRLGRTAISSAVERTILVYAIAYAFLFADASVVLVGLGLDFMSAMSAVVACLSSVGPGLEQVGPTQNFGFVPAAGKLVLCLCMIAGRLEIFALFAVFSPECWRR